MAIALRIRAASSDEVRGAVMDRFLHELTARAQEHGYRITLLTAKDDDAEVAAIDELRAGRVVDAAILTETSSGDRRPAHLERLGHPFVAFGRPWDQLPGEHSWVDVDGAAGTEAAARWLQSAGHERIGFIGWEPRTGLGDDRLAGWRRAVSGPAEWSIATSDATAAAEHLAGLGVTAVVCASDSLALGANSVFAAREGIVPVVGFDDTPVARALGISSVAQPIEDVAAFCIRSIVAQLEGGSARPTQTVLRPRLETRARL